ncbi:hypothetical protein B0H14DRAFT_2574318 [Mycena olivaceomarginata]|nr:hypothetical protein B0H14DRAFT_2574318 [Mycena olivaceomarginata]
MIDSPALQHSRPKGLRSDTQDGRIFLLLGTQEALKRLPSGDDDRGQEQVEEMGKKWTQRDEICAGQWTKIRLSMACGKQRETAGNGICTKPGRDLDRFSCRDTGGVARRVKDVGEEQGYSDHVIIHADLKEPNTDKLIHTES